MYNVLGLGTRRVWGSGFQALGLWIFPWSTKYCQYRKRLELPLFGLSVRKQNWS